MRTVIQLLRMPHWTKNLFMFLPLFFSGQIIDHSERALLVLAGFACFSLIASAVYIINDIRDVEADRQHPEKKDRPFASGKIPAGTGMVLAFLLVGGSLSVAYFLDAYFSFVLAGYFIMNVLYSMGLKHVPVLDISIIATGFLLRVLAGGILAGVFVSQWIIIMTFLLALFLGLAKRRDDVIIFMESGQKMRKSIDGYNLEFINASMGIMAAVVIVAYLMYTLSEDVVRRIGSEHLYVTSIFVIMGIMRYLQITFVQNKSGNPTRILLKDLMIQLVLAAWIITFFVIIYANENTVMP